MRTVGGCARSGLRGITLIEVVAAVSILGVVGYSLVGGVDLAYKAQDSVTTSVELSSALRKTAERLRAELRSTSDGRVGVATLPQGDSELSFQIQLSVGGAPAWGAFDRRLGPTEATQTLVGGAVRYTVVADQLGQRTLVRQLLDDTGTVRREEVLVRRLGGGDGTAPGFSIEQAGALWRVQVSQAARAGGALQTEEFHVRTRNG